MFKSLCVLALVATASAQSARVTATPDVFSGSVAPITVTWTFPSGQNPADCFIATFPVPDGGTPADINVTAIPPQAYPVTAPWLATAPMHYLECSMNTSFGAAGLTASWNLNVYNARFDVAVGLFTGGENAPSLVAWSNVITVTDKAAFMHGKLARWQQPDQMVVHFQSKNPSPGAGVRYGFSASNLNMSVTANQSTYSRTDLCQPSPAMGWGWHEPGTTYRALLENLPTDGKTLVFYQFGNDANGWSDVRNFTATRGADPTATVNVILLADKGVSMTDNSSQHWTEPQAYITAAGLAQHAREGFNLVMHSGDIAYATGMELKWEAFETEMDQVYATGAPYMVGLGNHEEDFDTPDAFTYYPSADSGGECGVPTRARFAVPAQASKGVWYSLDYGPVHFVMWDTEMDCAPGTDQYNFIKADLAAVDRTQTPWIIVFGHRPIYTGNSRDSHLGQIEPLLDQYNVSMSLYGHVHNAQLWCPFAAFSGGVCAKPSPSGEYAGVVHSVIGNAGQSLSDFPTLDSRTVYHAEEHGYSTMTASSTVLTFRYYSDVTKELHYEFNMTQAYPPHFA